MHKTKALKGPLWPHQRCHVQTVTSPHLAPFTPPLQAWVLLNKCRCRSWRVHDCSGLERDSKIRRTGPTLVMKQVLRIKVKTIYTVFGCINEKRSFLSICPASFRHSFKESCFSKCQALFFCVPVTKCCIYNT